MTSDGQRQNRAEANLDYLPLQDAVNAREHRFEESDATTSGRSIFSTWQPSAEELRTRNGTGTRYQRPATTARSSLRRRRIAAAVVFSAVLVATAGGLGYVVAERMPDVWMARAEIVMESSESQIDRYLATEVVIAKSSLVVDRAIADLPIDRETVDKELTISPIDAGVALSVEFADEDPDLALTVVDAVVASFLVETEAQTTSTIREVYLARIEELRTARAKTESQLEVIETANAAALAADLPIPNPTEERRLSLESAQLLDQIAGLESQVLVTDIQILNQPEATVVSEASLLPDRVSPNPISFAALGVLIGGTVAAALLFALGRRRTP